MLAAAAHHGPRHDVFADGPAGLGQADRDEPAGLGGGPRGLRIAFSGVLHNRSELRELLGHAGAGGPDGGMVLEAYAAWGEGCAERLLGEFAFVIWDPGRRRLVAARDATGTRMLFYARCAEAWLVASECGQLAAHPAHAPEPDLESLSRLLEL